jgi:hypothetical protein
MYRTYTVRSRLSVVPGYGTVPFVEILIRNTALLDSLNAEVPGVCQIPVYLSGCEFTLR